MFIGRFFVKIFIITFVTPVLSQVSWETDLNKAMETAQKENRKIVLVFSGSDWCIPCIKLEKEVWNSSVFSEYANDNYVMLRADFPRKRKNKLPEEQQVKNARLAEKYNPNGFFPYIVVMDAKGNVLGKTGYDSKKTPKDYIDLINSFK